ncbi:DUF6155 family protein [Chitinophagaceae bacterium MMS25-I14]
MRKKTSLNLLLQELTKEELIEEIEKICDRFEIVKDYFRIDLTGDTAPYVEAAKKKITGQFHTSRGNPRRPKASRLNKIISDFEILSIYSEDIIQLLLFRVTTTVDFIRKYNYQQPALLQSNLRAFARACDMIASEHLQEKYREQCADIVQNARRIYTENEMEETYTTHFS